MIPADTLFRALADPTRLRCLCLLAREGELCVCELTQALDAPQPRVSRHLAQLREAGLVTDRRAGQWVYYRLRDDLSPWVAQVLEATVQGLAETAPFQEDARRLAAMAQRPGAERCA